jgi:hypothetical protein
MTNPGNIVRIHSRNGGHASVYEANMWAQKLNTGLFSGSGVTQNTSVDMNVIVGGSVTKPDIIIAQNTAGYKIALDVIGKQTLAITKPASNSRISSIVVYTDDLSINSTDTTSTGSPSSCGIIVVNGTAGANPTAPSESDIRTAITADGATGSQAVYAVVSNILISSTTTAITNNLISSSVNKISEDWNPFATPISISHNGSRSYNALFTGDLSNFIQPKHRIQVVRSTPAPTQSTNLNGTTQSWINSSPQKMTFTTNFVISAWIKIANYQDSDANIISRYNGTNGWLLQIASTGQIRLVGVNNTGNNQRNILSRQSVPLNRWVHITAQLDMANWTITPTTNYIMFDGVDVPAQLNSFGTNPTSLVQAGNLQVGAGNDAAPFAGKIAQASVFGAKISQSQAASYMNQGLLGTEPGLSSAWSFNGNATDLNTVNPNNLSPQAGAVATNSDSPFGGQANGTNSSTLEYGIVQAVSVSSGITSIVIQAPEGCALPTVGGVSGISYSSIDGPFGFPGNSAKWRIQSNWRNDMPVQGPLRYTWHNPSNKTFMPIGKWNYGWKANIQNDKSNGGATGVSLYALLKASSGLIETNPVSKSVDNNELMVTSVHTSNVSNITQIVPAYAQSSTNSVIQDSVSLCLRTQEVSDGQRYLSYRGDFGDTLVFLDNGYL